MDIEPNCLWCFGERKAALLFILPPPVWGSGSVPRMDAVLFCSHSAMTKSLNKEIQYKQEVLQQKTIFVSMHVFNRVHSYKSKHSNGFLLSFTCSVIWQKIMRFISLCSKDNSFWVMLKLDYINCNITINVNCNHLLHSLLQHCNLMLKICFHSETEMTSLSKSKQEGDVDTNRTVQCNYNK